MTKYNLKLTTQQAHVVIQALDLFSRLGMGQFEIVSEVLRDIGVMRYSDADFNEKRDSTDALLDELKAVFGHPPNGSLGIMAAVEPSRIAYDIECVLRKEIAKQEQHGSHSVWHHKPLHTAKTVPLAEVTAEEELVSSQS